MTHPISVEHGAGSCVNVLVSPELVGKKLWVGDLVKFPSSLPWRYSVITTSVVLEPSTQLKFFPPIIGSGTFKNADKDLAAGDPVWIMASDELAKATGVDEKDMESLRLSFAIMRGK